MSFTVAIIGRPNVGKSTLFNRLTGSKAALVDDAPGLTRDRKEGRAELGEIAFDVIDTAGLERAENETIEEMMMEQTEIAMEMADVIFMVIDGKEGVTPVDEHFIRIVRKKNKPTILVVNKCESKKSIPGLAESYKIGFGDPVAVSAEHGIGMGELYDAVKDIAAQNNLSFEEEVEEEEDPLLQIALVGRPNVGKSTLFNKLLGENRSIAGPVAGTTRDSVYVNFEFDEQVIRLVDTAGMRKRAKRNERLEKLSVDDSYKAIQYANVVILLVDATTPLDKQELAIADHVMKEGRGLVLAINKWDLVDDKKKLMEDINTKLEFSLSQAKGVPVVTISALNGSNIKKVIQEALRIFEMWNKRISTGKLNKWLERSIERHIPPLSGGKRIKLRYVTQVKSRPPTFAIFSSSNLKDLPDSYLRYLTNSLREDFGFEGVPIRIMVRKPDNPYNKR